MNQKTIPTLLGLLLTTTLAISGGYFIQKIKGPTALLAQEEPLSVQVTNIGSQSFTISWLTEEKTTGSIKINNQIFLDQRDREGQLGSYQTHYVVAENLDPKTEYPFVIISNGKEYQEEDYRGKTANVPPNILPEADFAFGIVLDENQNPLRDALVFLSLPNASPLSALTNNEGYWSISLSSAYQKDLKNLVAYDRQNQTLEITVIASLNRTTNATTTTGNDHPVPPIIFGQINNFITSQTNTATPFSILSPTATPSLPEKTTTIPITLKNPQEGEVIKNLQPRIEGEGPPEKKIQIIIQSEPIFEAEVIIGPDGSWQWAPPQDLAPGEHTLTINYYDEKNVLQTITRRFQVVAQGTLSPTPTPITPLPTKAPTATPTTSTAPSPTITPTPKPTVMLTASPSPSASVSGQPVTGNLTPLILLVSMGTVMSGFAYFKKNKSGSNY